MPARPPAGRRSRRGCPLPCKQYITQYALRAHRVRQSCVKSLMKAEAGVRNELACPEAWREGGKRGKGERDTCALAHSALHVQRPTERRTKQCLGLMVLLGPTQRSKNLGCSCERTLADRARGHSLTFLLSYHRQLTLKKLCFTTIKGIWGRSVGLPGNIKRKTLFLLLIGATTQ